MTICCEMFNPSAPGKPKWQPGITPHEHSYGLTRLQVKLAEVLGGAEGDHHHAVPEDVLPCGHLESDVCPGDETVLLDHWVNRLHPAVPEVYPVERDERRNIRKEKH